MVEQQFESVCMRTDACVCVCVTHRVAAGFMDDNPIGEGLVVGLDVQRSLSPVQRVLLDEVHIVHPRNLHHRYRMQAVAGQLMLKSATDTRWGTTSSNLPDRGHSNHRAKRLQLNEPSGMEIIH